MSIVFPRVSRAARLAALPFALLIFGCGGPEGNRAAPPGAPEDDAVPAGGGAPERRVVMFLGTSLTDGYGLEREEAFPARVQEKADSAGLPWQVVNAGVSGEKSAGALQRLGGWLVRQPFDVLVVETGANDMLQGADLDSLAANLQAIVDTVRSARPGARVVLVGMRAAPNLGRPYVERFDALYPELARENGLPFVPFLLEGVAGERELNLADGIHPNARGHRRLAETVWRTLEPVLREAGAGAEQ
jgi:acyl-CoA thioesterase I